MHDIRSNAKLRPSGCLLACPAVGHLPACRPVRLHLRLQTFCQGGLGRGLHCGQYRALCTWQCNRLFGGPVSSATVLLSAGQSTFSQTLPDSICHLAEPASTSFPVAPTATSHAKKVRHGSGTCHELAPNRELAWEDCEAAMYTPVDKAARCAGSVGGVRSGNHRATAECVAAWEHPPLPAPEMVSETAWLLALQDAQEAVAGSACFARTATAVFL